MEKWLGDIGATVHAIPSNNGIYNTKNNEEKQSILVGDGRKKN